MTYKVIGLMSGSSLDGLDIAYVHLTEQRGAWSFELKAAECISYPAEWADALKAAPGIASKELLTLHTAYGKYTGEQILSFIAKYHLDYSIDFISSHGHTIFHNPANGATFQLGDGSVIAATTGISTVSDLRAMDVALGGQGAPIVPVGDVLLFPGYDAWLNLGGIANITLKKENGTLAAFDICACNQILNRLAARAGKGFDEGGRIAEAGELMPGLLSSLDAQAYYAKPVPKSLSNEEALELGERALSNIEASTEDLLRTFTAHIAVQIARVTGSSKRVLATGGGALNTFLVEEIRHHTDLEIVVPDNNIIQYKEAIVMALIGALRWRGDVNVRASVTGASRDSIGGAIWHGAA